MVTFQTGPALFSGFVATVAMTMVMMAGRAMGMTTMDMPLILGGMVTADGSRARRLGLAIHVVMMGTVAFGVVYAALFTLLDSDAALTGVAIGLVHGLLFGLMVLPMMPAIHPRMKASADGFHLDPPRIMGATYGRGTGIGLLLAHATYGLVIALVYGAIT